MASIPNLTYLAASPDRMEKFAPLMSSASGKLKVGIVWSGSVTFGKIIGGRSGF